MRGGHTTRGRGSWYGRRGAFRAWGHVVRGHGGVANGLALLGMRMGAAVSRGWVAAVVRERVRGWDVGSRVCRQGMVRRGVLLALGQFCSLVLAWGQSIALETGVLGRKTS
jgi:hypothetical protein